MTSVNSVYYNLFYFYNNFVCSFFVEFFFNKFFLVKKNEKNVLYAVLYVQNECNECCFVVSGCNVSRMYVDVCYCDMFSVGRVSVFWLWWCGWCRWRVGRGLGPGSGAVGWCYVCVRCESGFSVLMAGAGICVLCLADTCTS